MRRTSLLAAVTAALAFAVPAHAMGPQIVDKADDANYLNDNAPVVLPVDNPYNNTPTSVGSTPSADILTVEWRTIFGPRRTVRGFTVTMTLKAPPTREGVLYRATAETEGCSQVWVQFYSSTPTNTPRSSLRQSCSGDEPLVVGIPARVQGSAIVWTVELGRAGVTTQLQKGSELTRLGAHTRDFIDHSSCLAEDEARCTTNPTQYDVTSTATRTYTIGSS